MATYVNYSKGKKKRNWKRTSQLKALFSYIQGPSRCNPMLPIFMNVILMTVLPVTVPLRYHEILHTSGEKKSSVKILIRDSFSPF